MLRYISVTVSSMIINVETIGDRITKRQCSCVFASFRLDPINGVIEVGGGGVCDADGDGGLRGWGGEGEGGSAYAFK